MSRVGLSTHQALNESARESYESQNMTDVKMVFGSTHESSANRVQSDLYGSSQVRFKQVEPSQAHELARLVYSPSNVVSNIQVSERSNVVVLSFLCMHSFQNSWVHCSRF